MLVAGEVGDDDVSFGVGRNVDRLGKAVAIGEDQCIGLIVLVDRDAAAREIGDIEVALRVDPVGVGALSLIVPVGLYVLLNSKTSFNPRSATLSSARPRFVAWSVRPD